MTDNYAYWNNSYAASDSARHERPASAFSEHALPFFKPGSRVLELGCGRGADAVRIASAGHTVVATDFSDAAIEANRAQYATQPGLTFQPLEIAAPLPFSDGEFDVVYAHLSLHYLPDVETRAVFAEIRRILRPGGLLAFLCKSTSDPLYGQGTLLEPDMFFVGHVRHFFSEGYARSCLQGLFTIEELSSGEETFYERQSAYVRVIARVA